MYKIIRLKSQNRYSINNLKSKGLHTFILTCTYVQVQQKEGWEELFWSFFHLFLLAYLKQH